MHRKAADQVVKEGEKKEAVEYPSLREHQPMKKYQPEKGKEMEKEKAKEVPASEFKLVQASKALAKGLTMAGMWLSKGL